MSGNPQAKEVGQSRVWGKGLQEPFLAEPLGEGSLSLHYWPGPPPPRFHRVIRQALASSSREESWPGRLEAPGKGACLDSGQVCAAGVEAYLSGL